ncbi:hypothetical protein RZQ20_19490, partial [Raoultella ornithinolytica]|nr:hypothetical protein [Raoultella ornithinolytica]MDV1121462.1 hypothetical protein [Raoultella ornithinolytica]MDV1891633.1 hypothetical protein [Raoultella ornithinolytica]
YIPPLLAGCCFIPEMQPGQIPPHPVEAMIARRRERYPEDVFLFQSHSNRVKYHRRPVTIIAFNAALRRAARSLPDVNVSSSSARNIPD